MLNQVGNRYKVREAMDAGADMGYKADKPKIEILRSERGGMLVNHYNDIFDTTPMMLAIFNGDLATVKFLNEECDVEIGDRERELAEAIKGNKMKEGRAEVWDHIKSLDSGPKQILPPTPRYLMKKNGEESYKLDDETFANTKSLLGVYAGLKEEHDNTSDFRFLKKGKLGEKMQAVEALMEYLQGKTEQFDSGHLATLHESKMTDQITMYTEHYEKLKGDLDILCEYDESDSELIANSQGQRRPIGDGMYHIPSRQQHSEQETEMQPMGREMHNRKGMGGS